MIAAPGPIRTVLMSKLAGNPSIKVAAVAGDEPSAVEKMVTEDGDVAAVYIHLGGTLAGLDTARNVSKACPAGGILIIVEDIEGLDLRRNARMFGVNWSYALRKRVESGQAFAEIISSVGRGIQWIDPDLRRVLEAMWQVASRGVDLEVAGALAELKDRAAPGPAPQPSLPKGVQTFRSGNSGVGRSVGGVNRAS
jgi:DNA-binding NarL/FixJ family response regulator